MIETKKIYILIFFAILTLFQVGCTGSQITKGKTDSNKTPKESLLLKPVILFIKYHREHSTHIDGPTCPMYPSCAAYGEKAIERVGFYGFLLLVDRMFYRETGNLAEKYLVAPRRKSEYPRYYDPLEDSIGGGAAYPSFLTEDFSALRLEDY